MCASVSIAGSCRTMNVYVVACESTLSSHVACVVVHAFAAMNTTLADHELSGGVMTSE